MTKINTIKTKGDAFKQHRENEIKQLRCPYCPNKFDTKKHLKDHMLRKHPTAPEVRVLA